MSIKTVTVRSAGRKGKGVFALRGFRKGEIVLIYKKSKILNKHEIPKRWTGKYKYLDVVGLDKFMIMKPPECYINCSCDPNVYVKNWKFVAMHPIKKGEEIVGDCAINNDFDHVEKCLCHSRRCRKMYPGNFFKLNKKLQKKYLPYLYPWFKKKHKTEIEKLKIASSSPQS